MLDTSALLALNKAEHSGARVRHILGAEHAICPFMVLLELRCMTLSERGQAEADLR